ncbi:MAG: hypothetical protein K2H30_00890 [Clostridia bacterium]|nr:hypothetical protein [Clostridia bacterium]
MTSSEKKHYNKKFMPKYMKNMSIAVPAVIIGWVLLFFAAAVVSMLAIPDLIGKAVIIFFIGLVVALIVLITLTVHFNKKLIAQRKKELEEEYTEMSYEDAKAALTARGIINETGVVIPYMAAGGEVLPVLPFNEVKLHLFSANVCTKIITVVSFCNQEGMVMSEYLVDNALYNYIEKSNFDAAFYGGSEMLFADKGAFVKKVIKTRNSRGVGFTFMGGVAGAVLAEHAKNETPEMDAVLRVLRRENI